MHWPSWLVRTEMNWKVDPLFQLVLSGTVYALHPSHLRKQDAAQNTGIRDTIGITVER